MKAPIRTKARRLLRLLAGSAPEAKEQQVRPAALSYDP